MTAINVLRLDSEVHLVTDGLLAHHALGRVGLRSKAYVLPHLNAAVATRGPGTILTRLVDLICIEVQLAHQLRPFCEMALRTATGEIKEQFDLVVGSCSANGTDAFIVSNHSGHGADPWSVQTIPYVLATPPVECAAWDAVAAGEDPLANLVRCMVQQNKDHPLQIGGFVQVTTVAAEGIFSQIVRRLDAREAQAVGMITPQRA